MPTNTVAFNPSQEVAAQLMTALGKHQVIIIKRDQRSIGKTEALIAIAKKTEYPLVVGTYYQARRLRKRNPEVFVVALDDVLENTEVLIDDSVDLNDDRLYNVKVISGFSYTPLTPRS
jgi:hypothetical protein